MKRFLATALLMGVIGAQIPQETVIPDGAYGIWQCPSLCTNSPLYWSEGTGQSIVDKPNAACIRWYGDGYLIADHANSTVDGGVWNVNDMRVGEDAFLITKDGIKRYECIAIYLVERQTYDYIWQGKAVRPKKHDIVCASCSIADGVDFLAYYKFVKVEDFGGD